MEVDREIQISGPEAVGGRAVVGASLAGLAAGGPLVGMMAFSFIATMTLILICSPLFIIFSPLLIFVAFIFAGALVGFAVAAAMALTGVSLLALVFREFRQRRNVECGETVKEQGKNWAGYLHQNGLGNSNSNKIKVNGVFSW